MDRDVHRQTIQTSPHVVFQHQNRQQPPGTLSISPTVQAGRLAAGLAGSGGWLIPPRTRDEMGLMLEAMGPEFKVGPGGRNSFPAGRGQHSFGWTSCNCVYRHSTAEVQRIYGGLCFCVSTAQPLNRSTAQPLMYHAADAPDWGGAWRPEGEVCSQDAGIVAVLRAVLPG
jgi:hypothetical protein